MKHRSGIWRRILAWKWGLVAVYGGLLLASYIVRSRQPHDVIPTDVQLATVAAVKGDKSSTQTIQLAYREYVPANRSAPVVVLLHGSPGGHHDFRQFAPLLAQEYRVIVPDLPGFGSSTHDIPDYSTRAHARYVLELLDQLHVQKAHVLGFSMGGGVVLNMVEIAPERVESVVMLSAIGVQEMELLGNYYVNHSIHGLQLAGIWLLHDAVPHFGLFDHSMLDLSYARNFYDTDQRPLRSILASYAGPMLIIHGDKDIMVPVEAAREHYRLVPQSELVLLPDESHFYLFRRPDREAKLVRDFFGRVETNQVRIRATAEPERVALAAQPFNAAAAIPRAMGPTALVVFGLLALATLVSEDLTCVWAGIMAAEGRIGFTFAAIACLAGIFIGDILLFLAGRFVGRPVLRRAPIKWFVRPADIERSSAWFRRRGMTAIALSRFLPGTRLPTYVAAGLLDTSFLKFTFYFFVAAALWTPTIVGLSMLLGRRIIESPWLTQQSLMLRVVISVIVAFIVVRLLVRLSTFRGRRMLLGRWRRIRHWEFWPPWIFYPPVVLYIFYLGLRYRSLTLFTCANPAIVAGGFIGESKNAILNGLPQTRRSGGSVARLLLLKGALGDHEKLHRAHEFMTQRGLEFPVVLKPDAGQRGSGVKVVRSERQLENYIRGSRGVDVIIQEYAPGSEFGVFYYRYPDEKHGQIFSITRKLFPTVVGDGKSSLERLILLDERAVSMTSVYFDVQRARLWNVPAKGEPVQLVEIGTHCRGSVFEDGIEIRTEAMAAAIDELATGFSGFYFGRFDIRTPSLVDFQAGKNFKVVELNGVTSEATHIYDRRNSLRDAYGALFKQWKIAFEIGAQNRARGSQPTHITTLFRLLFDHWKKNRERSEEDLRLTSTGASSGELAPEV